MLISKCPLGCEANKDSDSITDDDLPLSKLRAKLKSEEVGVNIPAGCAVVNESDLLVNTQPLFHIAMTKSSLSLGPTKSRFSSASRAASPSRTASSASFTDEDCVEEEDDDDEETVAPRGEG